MTSPLAIAEIHKLQRDGLAPTAEDIIRINAFGLAVETARGKRPIDDVALLPRVAKLNDSVSFRQPTLGHEVWIDAASRLVDTEDIQTLLALNCYALSRDQAELCDPHSVAAVTQSVREYADVLKPFCRDQILTAIDYVKNGRDPDKPSRPLRLHEEVSDDERETYLTADWDTCVATGVLYQGMAIINGASLADLRGMTRRQLEEVVRAAAIFHGLTMSDGVNDANARFYMVVDDIRERLEKERGETENL